MENEGRLTPKDVATASENLKTFVQLMKAEALSRGTDRMDNKCFHAAQQKLDGIVAHRISSGLSGRTRWPDKNATCAISRKSNSGFAAEVSAAHEKERG